MIFRKLLVAGWLLTMAAGIGYLFWHQEARYLTPTPVPDNYKPIALQNPLALPAIEAPAGKVVFLHFFNPDCPCSRFNLQHFKSLATTYKSQVHFTVVIPSFANPEDARSLLPEGLPVILDENDALADACGVYASPQAVIISSEGKLYYRGNYNKSRYCTQKESNYAEMALNNLLKGAPARDYGPFSNLAYGCEFESEAPALLPILNF